MQQRPKLLTEAYCQCLQHWVEKVYLPTSPGACPLAESVRELCQAVSEFVTITKQDILEGLEMERPMDSHQPPPATIFSWVLGPQPRDERKHLSPLEFPVRRGCQDCRAEPACSFVWPPTQPPIHSPGAPIIPTSPPTRVLAVGQPSTLP